MKHEFMKRWLEATNPITGNGDLVVLSERQGERKTVRAAIARTVIDHLADLDIIKRIGGYNKARAYIRNKLPTNKRVCSGDFGEILATEYIDQCTEYQIPIKKLRWKDDRSVAMRGNDVIATRASATQIILLKVESKSRASLGDDALEEAVAGLEKHSGRPNPSTLAFISSRLREMGRDKEAVVFERFQDRTPSLGEIEQMVFTLSGNSPTKCMQKYVGGTKVHRYFVGCVITDHQAFITELFERLYARKSRRHRRPH